MKKIYLSLLLLLTSVISMYATHIVGGDLRVVFRSQSAAGPIYRIVANIYHDENDTYQLDPSYTVTIFRKRNNALIRTINVDLRSYIQAPYPTDNPDCRLIAAKTGLFLYDKELILDPAIYGDIEGYYATAYSCCRNAAVTNLPIYLGFAFYVEFPRVTNVAVAPYTVADAFVNSSPDFSILQTAYGCINQVFTNSFVATDPDGDVLTYDLVVPLNTSITGPATYSAGYSFENPFGSLSPAGYLRIDVNTGLVSVTPGVVGVFAFAVRCTESRNGIKIGETRREFQYVVRGDCAPPIPPVPQLPAGNIVGGAYILDLNNGPSLDFIIKGSKGKKISKIDIIPISANFTTQELDVDKIFSPSPTSPGGVPLNTVTGEGKVKLTWPPCLYSKNATDIYEFDMIVFDNSCPVSNKSTARIKLKVLQRNNPAPKWEIINTENIAVIDQNGSINVISKPILADGKETVKFTVVGRDLGDSLRIRARAAGDGEYFTFIPKNIKYTTSTLGDKDLVYADFEWTPTCSLARNNGRREELVMDIFIDERSTSCEKLRTTLKAKLILEDNGVTSDYQPVNVITPNGDGKNEFYTLSELRNATCLYKFSKITIHNRFGKEVFQSGDEKFAWNAEEYPTGLYYYRIQYENYEYKGSLQVLR